MKDEQNRMKNPEPTPIHARKEEEHPGSEHYQVAEVGYQPWDVIKQWGWFPEFAKANIIKYTWRAGKKETTTALDDLRKVQHYVGELIKFCEERENE